MYRYAQVDGCGFVVWLRTFPEPADGENMILVGEDFDPAGKRWNGMGWVEIPPCLPTPEETMQAKLDYLMMMAG